MRFQKLFELAHLAFFVDPVLIGHLIWGEARGLEQVPGFSRRSVNEFRAEFDGVEQLGGVKCVDPPADSPARFEDRNTHSRRAEFSCSSKPRRPRSNDRNVIIGRHKTLNTPRCNERALAKRCPATFGGRTATSKVAGHLLDDGRCQVARKSDMDAGADAGFAFGADGGLVHFDDALGDGQSQA